MVAEECWEEPLYEIEKMGVRVMKCRAGIVLGREISQHKYLHLYQN